MDDSLESLVKLLAERKVDYAIDAELRCVSWLSGHTVLTALPMLNGNVSVQAIDELTPDEATDAMLVTHARDVQLFWTHDETLHIGCGRIPERIDVTLPDKRKRDVYSAKVHKFVPYRDCKVVFGYDVGHTAEDEDDAPYYQCSECRYKMDNQYGWDDYQANQGEKPFHFCPGCGARIVGVVW